MRQLLHYIWLGGPLKDPAFMKNVADATNQLRPEGWEVVL